MPRMKPGLPSSEEIVPGALCPHRDHSLTSPDGKVPRYAKSGACVQCCAALTEGRLELNALKIHEEFRGRFMEFWALVNMVNPEQCWEWQGHKDTERPAVSFARGHGAKPARLSVGRIACYYTWGDVGNLPITHTCGNPRCCNPLHLKVMGVPHFHHRQRIAAVRLYPQAQALDSQIEVYLSALSAQRPRRLERLLSAAPGWLKQAEEAEAPS
jgi:hypothetical protein